MHVNVRLTAPKYKGKYPKDILRDFTYLIHPAEVKIGWYKNQYEPPEYKEKTADVAYRNETGFYIHHKNGTSTYVPPRPFLEASCYWFKEDWFNKWRKLYRDLFEEYMWYNKQSVVPDMMPALKKFCIFVRDCIQKFVYANDWIRANKESTLKRKKALGQPLIPLLATRTMIDSLHYYIKIKDFRSKNGVREFTE